MLSNFYWYLKIKLALHLSVQRVGKFGGPDYAYDATLEARTTVKLLARNL